MKRLKHFLDRIIFITVIAVILGDKAFSTSLSGFPVANLTIFLVAIDALGKGLILSTLYSLAELIIIKIAHRIFQKRRGRPTG